MKTREFFESAIASALDYGLLSEAEVVTEVGVELLVESLELPVRARLLDAAMRAERVDEELIVRAVGVGELCESLPLAALWRVLAIAGARASGTSPELPRAPREVRPMAPTPRLTASSTPSLAASSTPGLTASSGSKREAKRRGPDVMPRKQKPGESDRAITSVGEPDESAGAEIAEGTSSGQDQKSRKPNRRASGAGATSRRVTRESGAPMGDAMFASSRSRASARAATEPALPPDDDIAEIEVIDETKVE